VIKKIHYKLVVLNVEDGNMMILSLVNKVVKKVIHQLTNIVFLMVKFDQEVEVLLIALFTSKDMLINGIRMFTLVLYANLNLNLLKLINITNVDYVQKETIVHLKTINILADFVNLYVKDSWN